MSRLDEIRGALEKYYRLYEFPHADHPCIDDYRDGFDACYVALDEAADEVKRQADFIEELETQLANLGVYVVSFDPKAAEEK